ncbi:aminotransferase class V-fold PLP-dependent enzyme [Patulibacter minatonensis]|uniref:aminotransferase class V-fold PLP-dependent enzyme n=1 Tax=Patulibacter minatonensis TaxID=298163 RepID=UPI0004789EA6|nr:SufS family cysteine desulfurase [Patulibacter minatonensis]
MSDVAASTAPATLDVTAVRAQFPYLERPEGIVYLDSGASAQKPRPVLDAMYDFGGSHYANVHRGVHRLAVEADRGYDAARATIAAFVGSTPKETIVVKSVTEAINLVAQTWGATNVGEGDEIVITQMEHHANLVPWQQLAIRKGATLRYLEVDGEGRIDLGQLDGFLASGRVKLVAVAHVSNVLGTRNPVAEIVRRSHAARARVMVDGAQAVPQEPVDVTALGADFYGWTGHKLYGPTGIGVLHVRRDLLADMPPFLTGGDMINIVDFHETSWAGGIQRFEAGTPPIVEAVGLAAACDWVDSIGGPAAVLAHEESITAYALRRLAEVEGLRVVGPPEARDRGALTSFALDGLHPHDVAEILARNEVCVRAGQHCAEPLHRAIGIPATTRASFGVTTTREEIDALIDALAEARRIFS